jgi:hypothetical protein
MEIERELGPIFLFGTVQRECEVLYYNRGEYTIFLSDTFVDFLKLRKFEVGDLDRRGNQSQLSSVFCPLEISHRFTTVLNSQATTHKVHTV